MPIGRQTDMTQATPVPERTCSVEGCDRPVQAKGWCSTHYARARRNGVPGPAEIAVTSRGAAKLALCSVPGCDRPAPTAGYCPGHYARVRRTGDPGPAEFQAWRREPGTCSVEGCDQPIRYKTFCEPHYYRQLRTGTTGGAKVKRWGESDFDPSAACAEEGCNRPVQYRCRGYCQEHYRLQLKAGTSCAVDGCDRPEYCKGYCQAHYVRFRKTGDPGPAEIQEQGREGCLVEGCDRPHSCQGYCYPHYQRLRKTGSVGGAEIASRTFAVWSEDGSEGTCTVCGKTKPADEFYMQSTDPESPRFGRRHGRCKECALAEGKAWRDADPDRLRERQVGYRLRFSFGMTVDQYEALLAGQSGGCAICGKRPEPGQRRLAVDHCHTTGALRGILCWECNSGLGQFGDDADLIDRAAAYLEGAA